MTHHIKPTQLTRTGYEYQDLICIGFILDWYKDPTKYTWIRIEGELEHDTLKGLDDIICLRHDGSYDLVQVKFTINPSREDLHLSFDWMLKKKGQGTSMLQKWAEDVLKYSATGHLANASLRTNRKPDQSFKDTLTGNRIDYEKLPEATKERIDTQLGGSGNAKIFCSIFNFEHSEQQIENYESKLHDQLVPDHTSEVGFYRLRSAIRRSATHKNFPFPDGSWRLSDIEELLRTNIHQQLSQDFSIPPYYSPPSHSFHVDLLSKATTPGCHVISGQPGMGKSTYLSYLNGELVRGGTVVIRHHYWLGSNSIIDRISSEHALKSMMFQLHEIFPELVQHKQIVEMKFDECVRAIASHLRGREKTLVIIIDGLDHVHRDRSDTSQLCHLVNRIIPLKNEVRSGSGNLHS